MNTKKKLKELRDNLKEQRFEILDSSNDEIALQTINISIKSVQDRFDKYNK